MKAFFAHTSPKKIAWELAVGSILLTIVTVAAAAALMDAIPSQLPLAVAAALFSFSAIPLFIMALTDFKHELRRSYILLCVGIVLYGIGQLQFPLFEIIDGTAWVESGAVILPYVFSIGSIFFGMRRFGKIISLRSPWLSPWLALGSAIVVAVLSGFIVKGDQATVIQFELFLAAILFFSVMIALRIRAVTAERYKQALTLLAATFGMLVIAAFHHMFTALVLEESNWYVNSIFELWPPFVSAILFMSAGYAFATLRSADEHISATASPINVITYIASFASNPTAIDTSLDTLRSLTATITVETKLTKQQETALATVYKDLETYLINHEPLQAFTRESLREMVRTRFQFTKNTTSTFWSLFSE